MQPNIKILQNAQIKSERVVKKMNNTLATLTRPLCYDCNSTDVFCAGGCGFDFEECACSAVEREANGFRCKVCSSVAIDEIEYVDNIMVECPACGDVLCEANITTWPAFPAGSLCDDCYVATSMGLITEIDETAPASNGEIIVVQDDGPCACGRYHICDNCGIYRVSTKDKWVVIENIDLEFTAQCKCIPEKKFSCETCNVFRKNPADSWIKTDYSASKTATAAKKPITVGATASSGTTGYGTTTYVGKCRHYGEPLKFPDGTTVYASSSNSKRDKADRPDFGLYLDWIWKPSWRAEFIDWADYGTPTNFDAAYEAIIDAFEKAKAGKKVEVGCIGGHGRTGTVLACMGVLAGQDPADAIKYVRSEYCNETIETSGQEWFVRWFNAEWNELEFTEKEPESWYGWDDFEYGGYDSYTGVSTSKKTTYASSPSASYGGSHSQAQHFNTWVQGKKCELETCRHWDSDLRSFSGGKSITQNTLDKCEVPMNAWSAEAYEIVTRINKERPTTFKLNVIRQLDPVMITVKGYKVPKPVPTDKQHNPSLDNCACDVCRYLALGGSQLFDSPGAASLVHELDKNAKVIKMYVHGGDIIDVPIADSFEPKPPSKSSNVKFGERKGEYIYTQDHGWVWDQLGLAD